MRRAAAVLALTLGLTLTPPTQPAEAHHTYTKVFVYGTGQVALNHCWVTLNGIVGARARDAFGRYGFWCWVPVRH